MSLSVAWMGQEPKDNRMNRHEMFSRYGGSAKVEKLVQHFYVKVQNSSKLAPYFQNADFPKLLRHQASFISAAMGGPTSAITDTDLRRAHVNLHISQNAFDEMLLLFRESLREFDFRAEDIEAFMDILLGKKDDVVVS
jgi:hemoglobin